jgi:hypothetical protein
MDFMSSLMYHNAVQSIKQAAHKICYVYPGADQARCNQPFLYQAQQGQFFSLYLFQQHISAVSSDNFITSLCKLFGVEKADMFFIINISILAIKSSLTKL